MSAPRVTHWLPIGLALAALSAPLSAKAQEFTPPPVVETTIITGSAISDGKPAVRRENPADRATPVLPVIYEDAATRPAVVAPAPIPAEPATVVQAAK